jgi:hypothetical protein
VIVAAFAGAAVAIPTGGALLRSAPGVEETAVTSDLLGDFRGPERQFIERARAAPAVGRTAPSLDFESIDGGPLPLSDAGRPVILVFANAGCERCTEALSSVSGVSTAYFDKIYFAAVAPGGQGNELRRMLDESGGTGLLLGAEDRSNRAQTALGVKVYPTIVIVGAKGTVDAVFTQPVPPNVLYKFLQAAYAIERGD